MYNMLKQIFKFGVKNISAKDRNRKLDFAHLRTTNGYANNTKSTLDEVTWNDLNMDSVFESINHTNCSAGEEMLYSWLRNPLDNENEYEQRLNLIRKAEIEYARIEKLKTGLGKLAYCKYHLKEIMESKYESSKFQLAIHLLLAIANLAVLKYSVTNGISIITGILLLIFPINVYLHYRFKEKYGRQLEVLQYAMRMVNFCKVNLEDIRIVSPELSVKVSSLVGNLKSISKKEMSLFRIEGLDLVADYINITILVKEISYFSIAGRVQKLKDDINELYDCIGKLDAVISIITYRENLSQYCEPSFDNGYENIIADQVYHPLLEKPVSNSIELTKDVAITGSNMSGKSTFLRTIGINAIFAQSICTCLSKKYKTGFCRLITSISLNDAILESKSYFLMEAEAIKRMVDFKDDEYPTLILIDEIFKGTNPVERYAASMEILNNLGQGNTKVVVATHDLNILPELKGYEFYYFTENVTSEVLEFDYKIRFGTANTRNAVKILEYVKYPRELVKKIISRISLMECETVKSSRTC